jgi:hypothetical protein
VPAILLVAWALIARPGHHKAHAVLLGLVVSVLLTSFLTDIAKDAVGRPRPDLIARCKPEKSAPLHELVTIDVCTETRHHLLYELTIPATMRTHTDNSSSDTMAFVAGLAATVALLFLDLDGWLWH